MFPSTPSATAAVSVATRFYTPALFNHCARSYVWGMKYAAAHDITFDDELYFVAAMLHDLALTAPPFDSHRIAFEEAGGDLAWVFAVAAGWPVDRAARAEEIIVLHMRDDVAADVDPESHLLQVATAWDVAGRRPEEFASEVRASPRAVSPAGIRRGVSGLLRRPGPTQAGRRRGSRRREQWCRANQGESARPVGVRNFAAHIVEACEQP